MRPVASFPFLIMIFGCTDTNAPFYLSCHESGTTLKDGHSTEMVRDVVYSVNSRAESIFIRNSDGAYVNTCVNGCDKVNINDRTIEFGNGGKSEYGFFDSTKVIISRLDGKIQIASGLYQRTSLGTRTIISDDASGFCEKYSDAPPMNPKLI